MRAGMGSPAVAKMLKARSVAEVEQKLKETDDILATTTVKIRSCLHSLSLPRREHVRGGDDAIRGMSDSLESGWRKVVSMKVLIKRLGDIDEGGGKQMSWSRRHKHFARLLDQLATDLADCLETEEFSLRSDYQSVLPSKRPSTGLAFGPAACSSTYTAESTHTPQHSTHLQGDATMPLLHRAPPPIPGPTHGGAFRSADSASPPHESANEGNFVSSGGASWRAARDMIQYSRPTTRPSGPSTSNSGGMLKGNFHTKGRGVGWKVLAAPSAPLPNGGLTEEDVAKLFLELAKAEKAVNAHDLNDRHVTTHEWGAHQPQDNDLHRRAERPVPSEAEIEVLWLLRTEAHLQAKAARQELGNGDSPPCNMSSHVTLSLLAEPGVEAATRRDSQSGGKVSRRLQMSSLPPREKEIEAAWLRAAVMDLNDSLEREKALMKEALQVKQGLETEIRDFGNMGVIHVKQGDALESKADIYASKGPGSSTKVKTTKQQDVDRAQGKQSEAFSENQELSAQDHPVQGKDVAKIKQHNVKTGRAREGAKGMCKKQGDAETEKAWHDADSGEGDEGHGVPVLQEAERELQESGRQIGRLCAEEDVKKEREKSLRGRVHQLEEQVQAAEEDAAIQEQLKESSSDGTKSRKIKTRTDSRTSFTSRAIGSEQQQDVSRRARRGGQPLLAYELAWLISEVESARRDVVKLSDVLEERAMRCNEGEDANTQTEDYLSPMEIAERLQERDKRIRSALTHALKGNISLSPPILQHSLCSLKNAGVSDDAGEGNWLDDLWDAEQTLTASLLHTVHSHSRTISRMMRSRDSSLSTSHAQNSSETVQRRLEMESLSNSADAVELRHLNQDMHSRQHEVRRKDSAHSVNRADSGSGIDEQAAKMRVSDCRRRSQEAASAAGGVGCFEAVLHEDVKILVSSYGVIEGLASAKVQGGAEVCPASDKLGSFEGEDLFSKRDASTFVTERLTGADKDRELRWLREQLRGLQDGIFTPPKIPKPASRVVKALAGVAIHVGALQGDILLLAKPKAETRRLQALEGDDMPLAYRGPTGWAHAGGFEEIGRMSAHGGSGATPVRTSVVVTSDVPRPRRDSVRDGFSRDRHHGLQERRHTSSSPPRDSTSLSTSNVGAQQLSPNSTKGLKGSRDLSEQVSSGSCLSRDWGASPSMGMHKIPDQLQSWSAHISTPSPSPYKGLPSMPEQVQAGLSRSFQTTGDYGLFPHKAERSLAPVYYGGGVKSLRWSPTKDCRPSTAAPGMPVSTEGGESTPIGTPVVRERSRARPRTSAPLLFHDPDSPGVHMTPPSAYTWHAYLRQSQ